MGARRPDPGRNHQSSRSRRPAHRGNLEHTEETVEHLDLTAIGLVPWWHPDRREVTLLQILGHMIAETSRHAGQADILREQIDGRTGVRVDDSHLPQQSADQRAAYRARLERAAEQAAGRAPEKN